MPDEVLGRTPEFRRQPSSYATHFHKESLELFLQERELVKLRCDISELFADRLLEVWPNLGTGALLLAKVDDQILDLLQGYEPR